MEGMAIAVSMLSFKQRGGESIINVSSVFGAKKALRFPKGNRREEDFT
jgi:hypothetical protein